MKYRELNLDDLSTIYPKSVKTSINNLTAKDKSEYLSLYNFYRSLFTEYMIDLLDLKLYDEKIKNSEFGFKPVDMQDMDIYQYFSSDELRYLYLRNNIHLEKLTKSQADFFRKRLQAGNLELDDEAKKMIFSTYPKAIFEDIANNGEKRMILFGPDSQSFFASNDSIVVGVRYDEFHDNGLDDDEWFRNNMNQAQFLNDLTSQMNEDFDKKMPSGVTIIQYDDTSIVPRIEEKISEKGEER